MVPNQVLDHTRPREGLRCGAARFGAQAAHPGGVLNVKAGHPLEVAQLVDWQAHDGLGHAAPSGPTSTASGGTTVLDGVSLGQLRGDPPLGQLGELPAPELVEVAACLVSHPRQLADPEPRCLGQLDELDQPRP